MDTSRTTIRRRPVWRLAAAWTALCLTGCTVSRPLHYASIDDLRGSVHAGDRVRITTTTGRTATIEVVSVTETDIVGNGESIPLRNVARIDRLEFSRSRAWTFAGGAALAVLAVFLILLGTDKQL